MGNQRVKQGEEYTCALCHGTYRADVPEDFAEAEYEALFDETLGATDFEIVCDDCFIKITAPGPHGTRELLKDA